MQRGRGPSSVGSVALRKPTHRGGRINTTDLAIAFYSRSGTRINVGTAFLAKYESTTYLATAAHVLVGANPPVTTDWKTWATTINLVTPTGHLPFAVLGEDSDPLFGYSRIAEEETRIHDLVWFNLDEVPSPTKRALTNQFHTFELDESPLTTPGMPVTGLGFPDVAAEWPPTAPISTHGRVTEQLTGHFYADMVTQYGHSGGPILDESGRLVGIISGHRITGDPSVSGGPSAPMLRYLIHTFPIFEGHPAILEPGIKV